MNSREVQATSIHGLAVNHFLFFFLVSLSLIGSPHFGGSGFEVWTGEVGPGSPTGDGDVARSAGKDHPPTKTAGCAWGESLGSFVVVAAAAAAVPGISGLLVIASGIGVGIGSANGFSP